MGTSREEHTGPLMVFIGEKGRTRRSGEGRARRSEKAAARGWPRSRIEAAKKNQTDPNRVSGASSWSGNVQPHSVKSLREIIRYPVSPLHVQTAPHRPRVSPRRTQAEQHGKTNGVGNQAGAQMIIMAGITEVYHCIETHGRGANPSFQTHVCGSNPFSSSYRSGRDSCCWEVYLNS